MTPPPDEPRPGEREPVEQGTDEPLPALEVPSARIILVGTAAWAVALVLTLAVPALHADDRSWWPWACLAGILLGCFGLAYVRRARGNAARVDATEQHRYR